MVNFFILILSKLMTKLHNYFRNLSSNLSLKVYMRVITILSKYSIIKINTNRYFILSNARLNTNNNVILNTIIKCRSSGLRLNFCFFHSLLITLSCVTISLVSVSRLSNSLLPIWCSIRLSTTRLGKNCNFLLYKVSGTVNNLLT